jgi:aspartyl aminopeptidase
MNTKLTKDLLDFIYASPSPFHVVQNLKVQLDRYGYKELKEEEGWKLKPDQGYFVVRGGSIAIFKLGIKELEKGALLFGAHTDSPCLKIRPNPESVTQNYFQLGVEVYGGVLLSTWFDRDLSIAGKVYYTSKEKGLKNALVDFKKPVAVIPNLAIHLNRDANESRSIQKQNELPPILGQWFENKKPNFRDVLLSHIKDAQNILDYDLCFYDFHTPSLAGLNQEFLLSARLDNLLSCYVLFRAVLESKNNDSVFLVFNDHEEVGSESQTGAQGNFIRSIFERITETPEKYYQLMSKSLAISCDNAHGIHPNYVSKHDAGHAPLLNKGPVLKFNYNQRYSTSGETASQVACLLEKKKIPYQKFVSRNDMTCGSTIGPITATQLGIRTVDIGVPTFAMHSIRETAGVEDVNALYQLVQALVEDSASVL